LIDPFLLPGESFRDGAFAILEGLALCHILYRIMFLVLDHLVVLVKQFEQFVFIGFCEVSIRPEPGIFFADVGQVVLQCLGLRMVNSSFVPWLILFC
jgi:hypothetical protein